MAIRNLINLESVSKAFDIKPLLLSVSLGIAEGERIGVVGRNGGGKSTLLKVLAGVEDVDSGRVSRGANVRIGMLSQTDSAAPGSSVRDVVLGDAETHVWASNIEVRDVLHGLFGGFGDEILDRNFHSLSGGERRRVNLAKLLIDELDLLLLDEPTNHLDVEGVAWLANHLKTRTTLSVVVITHDRWFLDEVSENIWELQGETGEVKQYEGGYSAYVLSKAERQRQVGVENNKREMLVRKELAWLRRGAPARTAKPKFRIEAANTLIENEPPIRNDAELLNFATNRLGKTVYECQHISIAAGEKQLLDDVYWNIGPGDRIGIIGVNGSGKTTLMRTLAGEAKVSGGKLVTGITVKSAFLSQHLTELNPEWRVLEAVEHVAKYVEIGSGKELSASQLCERLGFDRESQWTPVGDLSGGERRRLQLTRLLMESPNVLLLDEPTNDFDVETLTALEDVLDTFAGTLLVISHDRYFLERVCNRFVGLMGDGTLRDLPGGVDEYLRLRAQNEVDQEVVEIRPTVSSAALARDAKKEIAKIEKQIEKVRAQETDLHLAQQEFASDHEKLAEVMKELAIVAARIEELEEQWMLTSSLYEQHSQPQ
ncbi:MAG: ABC-F family ATP-binding cassette domain-containing protein [Actinomycetes bacterium]